MVKISFFFSQYLDLIKKIWIQLKKNDFLTHCSIH
jgi:hypothetical protein